MDIEEIKREGIRNFVCKKDLETYTTKTFYKLGFKYTRKIKNIIYSGEKIELPDGRWNPTIYRDSENGINMIMLSDEQFMNHFIPYKELISEDELFSCVTRIKEVIEEKFNHLEKIKDTENEFNYNLITSEYKNKERMIKNIEEIQNYIKYLKSL